MNMKQRQTTLLWSMIDGTECRIAPYDGDRYQLMLRWRDQTIKTTIVKDYARALFASGEWRRERSCLQGWSYGAAI
jgi:hypothetical protein